MSDDDMTPEEFDKAWEKGESVEPDVRLPRRLRPAGPPKTWSTATTYIATQEG